MYYNPVSVVETNNWEKECFSLKKKLNINNPLIITSKGNLKRNDLSSIFNKKFIFSDIEPDPNFESCQLALNYINKLKFDGVIAIGGGSVMDTAKVLMASAGTGIKNLKDLFSFTKDYDNKIPSIFIPTTHGTGSEVTMWGTIWNISEKKKYSISHKDLYPTIAILDGKLTLSLPLDFSIITIMDTLSHSFESIWNKNANLTSTSLAIDSIAFIIKNIEKFKKAPNDLKIRNKLLIASNKAGLAFSNTKTAAAHSISYPLTLNYGIPHGIASSISLIPVLNINKNSIQDSIQEICLKLDMTFEELNKVIKEIPSGYFDFKLKNWGVKETELDKLASECFTKGRMDNNIVDLNKGSVINILKQIYE